jgi:hypothetical protein
MLVVPHVDGWSEEATEHGVSDRLVLRPCCRVYAEPVPDAPPPLRWANLSQPVPRPRLLDHVVGLARVLTGTPGRKRRLDGTVVEPHRHHPTDSTWLDDGVRGLSRTLGNAQQVLQATHTLARQVCRERTRRAKRQRKRSMGAARQRGAETAERLQTADQHLRDLTRATRRQAQQAGPRLKAQALPVGQNLAKP